mgnify:CR=1 FL=1
MITIGPKISVITIVYNGEKYIRETILSLINQGYENLEYIIIDGGSTDNTLNIIKSYKNIKLISENDKGIYDAMNKGIKAASGDYILFLNSGDFFITNNAVKLITNAPNIEDLIFCDIQIRSKKEVYHQINSSNPKQILLDRMICHQAILHKRSLL